MLIRTKCKVYASFAEHCSRKTSGSKPRSSLSGKYCDSPKPASTKLLPSPTLPPRTKLSPLLPFQSVCGHAHPRTPSKRGKTGGSILEKLARGRSHEHDHGKLGRTSSGFLPPKKNPEDEDEKECMSTFMGGCGAGDNTASSLSPASEKPSPVPAVAIVFCSCGRPCDSDVVPSQCSVCRNASVPVIHHGYLYDSDTSKGVWKRYWYRLLGCHLYRK